MKGCPLIDLTRRLAEDEDGAALLEYTVLLGILMFTVIAMVPAVGGWISKEWTALNSKLT